MIKICDHSIIRPLYLIYERCIESGQYPQAWKRANVLPIHKKESRQLKKNYRPISILPICGKIFEKLVFDVMYEFLNKNNLLTPKQSGFRQGDSTINQLLSITNEIHKAFDKYPTRETRAIFLDISKAFDKVWHEGLIFKLKSNGVSDKRLDLIKSFLSERYQRVVLNGKSSSWKPVHVQNFFLGGEGWQAVSLVFKPSSLPQIFSVISDTSCHTPYLFFKNTNCVTPPQIIFANLRKFPPKLRFPKNFDL